LRLFRDRSWEESRLSNTLSRVGVAADDLTDERSAHHLIEEMKALSAITAVDVSIRPFKVDVPEDQLSDLRRRIAATRWPEKETVADASQGVQLATMQKLMRYWAT
jgi:Epoxide hydrolase N terminus